MRRTESRKVRRHTFIEHKHQMFFHLCIFQTIFRASGELTSVLSAANVLTTCT